MLELKLVQRNANPFKKQGFNRTMLELKQASNEDNYLDIHPL